MAHVGADSTALGARFRRPQAKQTGSDAHRESSLFFRSDTALSVYPPHRKARYCSPIATNVGFSVVETFLTEHCSRH